MAPPLTPAWCRDSQTTQSYVSNVGRGGPDPRIRELFDETGAVLRIATDFYRDSDKGERTFTSLGLNLRSAAGWVALAGRLRTDYVKAHFQLISTDRDYRWRLGGVMDELDGLRSRDGPPTVETISSRNRRYLYDCHRLVKNAIFEGVPTATAVFAVVPGVVAMEYPDEDPQSQALRSGHLLTSAKGMAQFLARHSRRAGNDRFIMNVCTPASLAPNKQDIRYNKLTYRPEAFTTHPETPDASPALRAVTDNRAPLDLNYFFHGCPGIIGGSVAYLVGLVEKRIQEEACFERAFGVAEPVAA